MSGQDLVRTTPFPNALFELMPKLRDTEWRVLSVVVRFTCGFVDPYTKRRKLVAQISHRQFKRWTGRESEAICRAIDVLVRAQVIDARDSVGRTLSSRDARRRARQTLTYGVALRLLG